jgi:hypothetical protein
MGIDGIGKPGPGGLPPDVGRVGGPEGSSGTGESFSVAKPNELGSVEASGPLGALERGEIGFDAYLDQRAAEAVRPLEGKLSADELEFVRSALREQLETDPVLVELVRRTTGRVPVESSG